MEIDNFLGRELWGLVAYPDMIARGAARQVFASKLDPSSVWKVEDGARSFQNVNEWEFWNHVKDGPLAEWLAPCEAISSTGAILLQKRTRPVSISELPDKIPAAFTDLKVTNWGMFDNRIVCHDYGKLILDADVSTKLVRAKWWEEPI